MPTFENLIGPYSETFLSVSFSRVQPGGAVQLMEEVVE